MLTRTEPQPVAGQRRHTRSRVTAWWIGALAASNWRWYGTLIRVSAALILLECVIQHGS